MNLAEKQKELKVAEIKYNKLKVETRLMQLDEEKDKLREQIAKHDAELEKLLNPNKEEVEQ